MNDMDMNTYELAHHGVKGMKWGVRKANKRSGYRSTGIRSALARRSNEKVDKGFRDWDENTKLRDSAIDLGKKANAARIAYEKNKGDKGLKSAYKTANKQYKSALSKNTTYRKGVVRQEVGKDISRKYLSEAKKVKKQLDGDISNKSLQKQYDSLMSKHDVERAAARRAKDVGEKRSRRKAAVKRGMSTTVKSVAATAAIAGGTYAVNKYLTKHEVSLNGKRVRFSSQKVSQVVDLINRGKKLMSYVY